MSSAALVFALLFLIIIAVPCLGIAWLGVKTINRLGRFPSKTPAINMDILFKLILIEVVSITLMLTFFKVLAV